MFTLSLLPRVVARPRTVACISRLHISRTSFLAKQNQESSHETSGHQQHHNSTADSNDQQDDDSHRIDNQQQPEQAQIETVDKAEYDQLLEQTKLVDAKYKRSLADMENLRTRLQKELDDTKKYAIQKFCKDLIEVTDVMQIALGQISPEAVGQSNYDGFKMIEQRTKTIFSKHGLISLNPIGLKFDPYEHQAVFENPDDSKEPGTISEVCKEGWKLHDRIVRPAVVGVYKKP